MKRAPTCLVFLPLLSISQGPDTLFIKLARGLSDLFVEMLGQISCQSGGTWQPCQDPAVVPHSSTCHLSFSLFFHLLGIWGDFITMCLPFCSYIMLVPTQNTFFFFSLKETLGLFLIMSSPVNCTSLSIQTNLKLLKSVQAVG